MYKSSGEVKEKLQKACRKKIFFQDKKSRLLGRLSGVMSVM